MELFYHLWKRTEALTDKEERIVLLHGMGGTGALWRPIAASLEDEMSVLAPDQRGHGKSRVHHIPGSRTEPKYTPLDYGRDVIDTLESIPFHPTWVLGHSMGVRTAVAAAHLRPSWVKGLILVDLGLSGVAGGGLGEGLADFLKRLPARFSSREDARKFMSQYCPDPSIAQYLMAVSVQDAEKQITFPFDHAALIQTIYAARDVSVRTWIRDLGGQGVPILILRGEKSLVWSREEFEQERSNLAFLKSIVFREVPNAGHGLPFEQRAVFLQTVREFMRERGV